VDGLSRRHRRHRPEQQGEREQQFRLPLERRKECLKLLVPARGVIAYGDHVEGHGAAFLDAARDKRREGVIAKKRGSPYVARRSRDWLKISASSSRSSSAAATPYPRARALTSARST